MYYELQKDQNTGDWWIVQQEEDGFRKIVATLSADLTYFAAKTEMKKFLEEKGNE
tara:strand:- start:1028 stop:1192 length:165 start_codon:yes stop_codon:yes gene_type:complete